MLRTRQGFQQAALIAGKTGKQNDICIFLDSAATNGAGIGKESSVNDFRSPIPTGARQPPGDVVGGVSVHLNQHDAEGFRGNRGLSSRDSNACLWFHTLVWGFFKSVR